jgi:hypothetical protein
MKQSYIIVLLFYINFILIINSPDKGHKSDWNMFVKNNRNNT